LHADIKNVPTDSKLAADYYCDIITPQMQKLRDTADLLEKLTAKSYWPYPLYSDILFY
jgi:glutamine synthetase